MSLFHAVVWLDHHHAKILEFHAEEHSVEKIKEHAHHTRQHNSSVRTEHEFFGSVCDGLAGIGEVLVCASQTALSDFKHYVTKHRPNVLEQIIQWKVTAHESDAELLSLAREHFLAHDRMAGIPTPDPQ